MAFAGHFKGQQWDKYISSIRRKKYCGKTQKIDKEKTWFDDVKQWKSQDRYEEKRAEVRDMRQ